MVEKLGQPVVVAHLTPVESSRGFLVENQRPALERVFAAS